MHYCYAAKTLIKMTSVEFISVAASVFGLVVGILSALAAFRSADSARKAQLSADAAIRNNAVVIAGKVAAEILADFRRIQWLAECSRIEYKTLEVLCGSTNNAGIEQAVKHVATLLEHATDHANYAQLFLDTPSKLIEIDSEDLTRVQVHLNSRRSQLSALVDELERDLTSTGIKNMEYRSAYKAKLLQVSYK